MAAVEPQLTVGGSNQFPADSVFVGKLVPAENDDDDDNESYLLGRPSEEQLKQICELKNEEHHGTLSPNRGSLWSMLQNHADYSATQFVVYIAPFEQPTGAPQHHETLHRVFQNTVDIGCCIFVEKVVDEDNRQLASYKVKFEDAILECSAQSGMLLDISSEMFESSQPGKSGLPQ